VVKVGLCFLSCLYGSNSKGGYNPAAASGGGCLLTTHAFPSCVCSCSARPPRTVEGSGSDGPLQCQRLVLAGSPTTEVVLDPSTYGYQGCSCKAPFSADSTVQGGVTTSLQCVVPSQVCAGDVWARVQGVEG
jgi:hypothetical protein